jgi:hypothetical protein
LDQREPDDPHVDGALLRRVAEEIAVERDADGAFFGWLAYGAWFRIPDCHNTPIPEHPGLGGA